MMQDIDRDKKSYANIDTISKFKNKYKPMVIDKMPNTTSYFLPGPNQNIDKRESAKKHSSYKENLKMSLME